MQKSPEQIAINKQEIQQEILPDNPEITDFDIEHMKGIQQASETAKKEEQKNPERIAELHEQLDQVFELEGPEVRMEQLSEVEKQNRQERWNKTLEDLDNITDGLGKPIDAGIKESVASFMVNGYPAQGSCEGHVEKRYGKRIKISPYIDVGVQEPKTRFIGEKQFREEIAGKHGVDVEGLERNKDAWVDLEEYISQNKPQETAEYIATRKANQKMESGVRSLLDEFYGETPVENRKVRIPKASTGDGNFRVTTTPKKAAGEIGFFQSFGAKKELHQEQEEFSGFAKFMKERYLGKE